MTGLGILSKVRDGSRGPLKGPGWVGWSSRWSGSGRGPSRMSGTGRVVLPVVRDSLGTLSNVRDASGGPPGGSVRVGGPSRRFGMGWLVLLVARDWSVDPPGGPGLVEGPSWRSGMVPGTLLKVLDGSGSLPGVRNGSRGLPEGPGRVRGPSQRFGTGWGTLPKVRDGSGDPP